jgi:hypothetical protein
MGFREPSRPCFRMCFRTLFECGGSCAWLDVSGGAGHRRCLPRAIVFSLPKVSPSISTSLWPPYTSPVFSYFRFPNTIFSFGHCIEKLGLVILFQIRNGRLAFFPFQHTSLWLRVEGLDSGAVRVKGLHTWGRYIPACQFRIYYSTVCLPHMFRRWQSCIIALHPKSPISLESTRFTLLLFLHPCFHGVFQPSTKSE